MGNVSSRVEDGSQLHLKDQHRLSISSVRITNSRNRTLYSVLPNSFPATRFIVSRDVDDESPVDYVQDPESAAGGPPNFLLRLNNDEDLFFYFTFSMRQTPPGQTGNSVDNPNVGAATSTVDTAINSLTFLFASSPKELETLVTREFNADPNLHKNPNVDLVGDYTTGGNAVEQFEWSWKWRPPKPDKDKGGGWRTSCSFVEYEPRNHRLQNLVTFSFWVNNNRIFGSPKTPSARLELNVPPRFRIPSTQSVESRMSDSDTDPKEYREPPSPAIEAIPEDELNLEQSGTEAPVKVDINYQRPGEDISAVEDGPVFRATMKALEQKTGNMRARMKQVLRRAEAAKETQIACNRSVAAFMEALRGASSSNANAVQPALDHYFEKIATEILAYEKQNADILQKLIIDPISKLYSNDIKQVEAKRKDFEDESRDFYAYVGRYLGQRQDSLKEKKRAESDSKYQSKRRNFELKRFDYSSFMQDLHGGRKDQEVLSQLTRYADTQAKGYLATAKKVEAMMPQLDALCREVKEADKEYQLLRTGREEKRRTLEKSSKSYDPDAASVPSASQVPDMELTPGNALTYTSSLSERPRSGAPLGTSTLTTQSTVDNNSSTSPQPPASVFSASPGQNKFKGIRDLEEKDPSATGNAAGRELSQRREGLLWSLSRPGSHADPKGLNKQAWHKYWIVLDQGRLCEYVNWKDVLEQHRDPIDLRMASVREARNSERRFCFEVITPNFTRVYQATSEDDMKSWIQAINNALQGAFEGKSLLADKVVAGSSSSSFARDLFGKSSSFHGSRSASTSNANVNTKNVSRHATVGDRPPLSRSRSSEDKPARLLRSIREADAGNSWCADCGTGSRVEWVSINLGIVVCIECSGIHRSLGTHITKIRSLTLDTVSFTQDMIELLRRVGNRVSNMVWEATLDPGSGLKPGAASTRDHRLQFISSKYARRAFVSPLSPSTSRFSSADEMLLASIKRNDLQNVIHALALNANPNAADRSRSTHAIFLALAAADPAAPSSTSTSTSTSSSSPTTKQQSRQSFAVAELLMQNGAELPSQPAPIPLSNSSQLYVDFKRDQKLGRTRNEPSADASGGAPMHSLPLQTDGSGDTITALPAFDASGSLNSRELRPGDASERHNKRSSAGATAGAVGAMGRFVKGAGAGL